MTAKIGFRCRFAHLHCAGKRHQLPERRQADENIDDGGKRRVLAPENRRHQIEIGNADQQSVDAADDDEKQGDDIKRAHGISFRAGLVIEQAVHGFVPQKLCGG